MRRTAGPASRALRRPHAKGRQQRADRDLKIRVTKREIEAIRHVASANDMAVTTLVLFALSRLKVVPCPLDEPPATLTTMFDF